MVNSPGHEILFLFCVSGRRDHSYIGKGLYYWEGTIYYYYLYLRTLESCYQETGPSRDDWISREQMPRRDSSPNAYPMPLETIIMTHLNCIHLNTLCLSLGLSF